MKNQVVGIIGGKGKTGQQFAKFFRVKGFRVIVNDSKQKPSNQEIAQQSNFLFYCVPINKTVHVIRENARFAKKAKAIADFTSVKQNSINALKKFSPRGAEVFGLHPMFASDVKNFKGQVIVCVKGRGNKWLNFFKKMFAKAGAETPVVSAKEHDELMAVIQGLIHFSLLATAKALKELKFDLNKTLKFRSPIYKMRFDMIGRILNQDAELYADIQLKNKDVKKVVKAIEESTNELAEIVKKENRKDFLDFFDKTANYFGKHKELSAKKSIKVIEALSK